MPAVYQTCTTVNKACGLHVGVTYFLMITTDVCISKYNTFLEVL